MNKWLLEIPEEPLSTGEAWENLDVLYGKS